MAGAREEWARLGSEIERSAQGFRALTVASRSEASGEDASGAVTVTVAGDAFRIALASGWEAMIGVDGLEPAIAEALSAVLTRRYDVSEFGAFEVVREHADAAPEIADDDVAADFLRRTSGASPEEFEAHLDQLVAAVRAHAAARLQQSGPRGIATAFVGPDGQVNHIGIEAERARGVSAREIEDDITAAVDAARVSRTIPLRAGDVWNDAPAGGGAR